MNRQEANKLLDEYKHGLRIYPVIEITKALWLTGDLGHVIPRNTESPSPVVFSQGFQRVRMGKDERT